MSYYRSPMGDYKTYGYQGDPGFLSSLWKGIKAVGKVVLGIPPKPVPQVIAPIMAGSAAGAGMSFVAQQYPPGFGATGGALYGRGGSAMGPMGKDITPYGAAPPRGYHLAKDGSGRYVRNRRMNVANPRALRKAMRRVQGFEKLAKRTISFTRRVKMKR